MKLLLLVGCLAGFIATSVSAETINRRNECDRWEHIPASEELGSVPTALLFCNRNEQKWLALRVDCDVDNVRMVVRYRPGFSYAPPAIAQDFETGAEGDDQLTAEEREAAAVVAAIPYHDSGIRTEPMSEGGPTEMVFMDFQSFGYTGVAHYQDRDGDWEFIEKQPLSPIFSRMITGNYADIKLLAYGITERFPLRGSSKALRPVVETCRVAKRNAERATKN